MTLIPLGFWVVSFFLNDKSENRPAYYGVISILVYLITLAMIIFYIVNVFKNERVPQAKKITWVILIFLFGLILMPIYWYKYLWAAAALEPIVKASENSPQINEPMNTEAIDLLYKQDDQ